MLREVSRHKNIEQITMVEIDAGVVEFCRQYLPNHSAGAYDDPRFKLVIDDGVNFVNQTTEKFDVIISDCTDPIGPGESLFTSVFYEGCARSLNEGGSSLHKTASVSYNRMKPSIAITNLATISVTLVFIRPQFQRITAVL